MHIAESGCIVNTSSRSGFSFVKNSIRIRQERVGFFYQKLCWPNVLESLPALLSIISGVSSMVTCCLALGEDEPTQLGFYGILPCCMDSQ